MTDDDHHSSERQRGEPKDAPDFRRSGRAAALLGKVLAHDLGAFWRHAGDRLRQSRRRQPADRAGAADEAEATGQGGGRPARARRAGWRGLVLPVAFGGFGAGVVLLAGILWWALHDVPWGEIAEGTLQPVVALESADGSAIVSQGPYQDKYTGLDAFPDHLIDAVLSVEDRRFYDHIGIDIWGIGRALVRNIAAGEVVQGGSTITQQLIKILYLERDRTYRRKIQELVIALWLEQRLGKDEILTRYLNNIYLGAGATGVPAAARIYFDKEPSELTLRESAMIAGLIRAPSALNPLSNPDGARARTQTVLNAMVDAGTITKEQASEALTQEGLLNPTDPAERAGSWFADWVMREARQIAGPYRGGISVTTTLLPGLQSHAERVVREVMAREGAASNASQAALVALQPDGATVAMVGGVDYAESSFNRATDAMRQPGSTFKTFVLYAALKSGIGPRAMVVDEPIEIDGWTPENFAGRYRGRVPVYEAFARSLNAAMVALGAEVGFDAVADAARELGIDAPLDEVPALALGVSEVSLLDLTGAYASILAGAAPVEPWAISAFRAMEGGRAFRVGPPPAPQLDISPYRDDLVGLLQLAVEQGTGQAARTGGLAAGKTGTSQEHRDAWFVGFTDELIAGVWVGNDDDTPMREVTGGSLPATIWREFMIGARGAILGGEAAAGEESESAPRCNVEACARAYRSFRASDCTFQPYSGPRRLCEK